MYKIEHKAIIITPPMKIDLFFSMSKACTKRPVVRHFDAQRKKGKKRAKKGLKPASLKGRT